MPAELESVRTRQIVALRTMINLNEPVVNSGVREPVWKVLVLDRTGQDIISPLLPVKQLRELGVTLHLLIGARREPLTDVPAVYFVSPNDENIDLMSEDLKKAMYDSFYCNFISPLARPRLESLASAAVHGGAVSQVQKVVDQYLNFISLEDDLFVLRRYSENSTFSYHAMNSPGTSDVAVNAMLDSIADGLFAVCATMGIVPIIRCPKGNAAEMVAKKLDQKLRDNLRDSRNNLFTMDGVRMGLLQTSRPLLVIGDRSADLATMLHHTWTYQALMHDVLELDQNRVTISTSSTGKKKDYDMATGGSDKLWNNHKGSAFPTVAEAVQENLDDYRSKEDDIKKIKQALGLSGESEAADEALTNVLADTTAKLGSTVMSLPDLLESKRLIDLHTNIATTLLDVIKERKLDVLFELEQKLLQHSPLDQPVTQFLSNINHQEDVLRVLIIAFLCQETVNQNGYDQMMNLLRERGIEESALKHVQKLKSISQLGSRAANSAHTEEHQGAGTKTISMFGKLLSHSSKFVMEGVKNLVPKEHNLPLTKMIDSLNTPPSSTGISSAVGINQMIGGSSQGPDIDDIYCFFDPKLMHQPTKETILLARQQSAQDVILFVVGGGNYVEYQNLVDYGKRKNLMRVTYGCTELVNPAQFCDQVSCCSLSLPLTDLSGDSPYFFCSPLEF
ncbi:Sec1 family domain-containing protein 1 [Caenorhabditis elegans]|uniref:Sec1 family domain-containing protein 1 n=1 Tax=Caenorhabditis elegans TaxID=6239 RepID=Q20364_CAEEL|nr:Sec1 family domain-containing protein 1 [Caenorhabditis elegans]CAA84704.4 Sec1 family domain-containing protein 1 [Caenorhabditis elegans]|eukprot:NP_499317.2 SLY1 homolog [Caenorhabditis elegans]